MSDSSRPTSPSSTSAPPQRHVSGSLKDRIAKFENLGGGSSAPAPVPRQFGGAQGSYARGGLVGNRLPSLDQKTAGITNTGPRRVSERRDLIGNRVPSSTNAGAAAALAPRHTGSSASGSASGPATPATTTFGSIGLGRPGAPKDVPGEDEAVAEPSKPETETSKPEASKPEVAEPAKSERSASPEGSVSASASSSVISAPQSSHSGSAPTSATSSPATSPSGMLPPQLLVSSLPRADESTGAMTPLSTRAEAGEEAPSEMSMPATPVAINPDLPRLGDLVPGNLALAAGLQSQPMEPTPSISSSLISQYDPMSGSEESANLKDVSNVSTPTGTPRQAHKTLDDEVSVAGSAAGSTRGERTEEVEERMGAPSAHTLAGEASERKAEETTEAESASTPGATVDSEASASTPLIKEAGSASIPSASDLPEPPLPQAAPAVAEPTTSVSAVNEPETETEAPARDSTATPTSPDTNDGKASAVPDETAATPKLDHTTKPTEPTELQCPVSSVAPIAPVGGAAAASLTATAPALLVKDEPSAMQEDHDEAPAAQEKPFLSDASAAKELPKEEKESTPTPRTESTTVEQVEQETTPTAGAEKGSEAKQWTPMSTTESPSVPKREAAPTGPPPSAWKAPTPTGSIDFGKGATSEGGTDFGKPPAVDFSKSSLSESSPIDFSKAPLPPVPAPEPEVEELADDSDDSSEVTTIAPRLERTSEDTTRSSISLASLTSSASAATAVGAGREVEREREATLLASQLDTLSITDPITDIPLDREATPVPESGGQHVDSSNPPPALDDDSDIVSVMGGMSERGDDLASNRSSMPPARASSELEFRYEELHERFSRPQALSKDGSPDSPTAPTGDTSQSPPFRSPGPQDVGGDLLSANTNNPTATFAGSQSFQNADPSAPSRVDAAGGLMNGALPPLPSVPSTTLDGNRRPVQVHIEPSPHGVLSAPSAPEVNVQAPSPSGSTFASGPQPDPSTYPSHPSASSGSISGSGSGSTEISRVPTPAAPQFPTAPGNDIPVPDTPIGVSGSSTPSVTPGGVTPGLLHSFPSVPDEEHPYVEVHVTHQANRVPFPRSVSDRTGLARSLSSHSYHSQAHGGSLSAMPPKRTSSLRAPLTPPTHVGSFGVGRAPSPTPGSGSSPNLSVEGLEDIPGQGRRKRNSFTPRSPHLGDEDPGDFEPGEGWAIVNRWEPWRSPSQNSMNSM